VFADGDFHREPARRQADARLIEDLPGCEPVRAAWHCQRVANPSDRSSALITNEAGYVEGYFVLRRRHGGAGHRERHGYVVLVCSETEPPRRYEQRHVGGRDLRHKL